MFGVNGTGDCKFKTHCEDPSDNNCEVHDNERNCQYSSYTEKLLVGYRWYNARGVKPAFPFGE